MIVAETIATAIGDTDGNTTGDTKYTANAITNTCDCRGVCISIIVNELHNTVANKYTKIAPNTA